MRKSGAVLVAMGLFATSVSADPAPPGVVPTPEPGSTQATFESKDAKPFVVLVDGYAVCRTPCSVVLPPLRRVELEHPDRNIKLDYLPEGSVIVRGQHQHPAVYVGLSGAILSGFGLLGGIPAAAIGAVEGDSAVRNAGLIVMGASALTFYLSIKLGRWARAQAEVLPVQPYVSGSGAGFAGSF
ncbi:MAG: hypothetical protein H0T46_16165 [Deltaproteobacteria bacterium]|nr:hypothetical protein [Deltaproteobacteria bacterium]